ncbi:TRAP transporter substrate-binding protein [Pararhodobacter sp. SW119]|uniref:TRAP transporter substrate-binding protein n=1 Tax=Pararhodobacter sp. SW119 TaxID=2780075 RepID=UPI001AE05988|nr:TRAP transporter substrate-binding protein [Pararhodobacter sp. SW119]
MTHHILKAIALAGALALPGAAGAQVSISLDSPPDLEGSGSYVWAHAFAEHLNANGMEAQEFQRGALGGDDEVFDQVTQGLVEIGMSPLAIVASVDTLIFGLRLPYFFENMEEIDRALLDGGMLDRINEPLAPAGVRVLDVVVVGPATGIFNTRRAVETLDDMAGLRMRALDESQIALFRAWGAAGTIVSWAEVPNALQTGVADGYLNPAFVPLLFGHTEFIRHFTDAGIAPSLRIAIASEDWYQGLSDEERALVDDAVEAARRANRDWLGTQDAVIDQLREAGVAVVELDDAARAEFQEASVVTYTEGVVSPEELGLWTEALGR